MKKSSGKTKQIFDSCSIFVFVMFIFCSFLILFSYTDSLSVANTFAELRNTLDDFDDDTQFSTNRYTWKCQNNQCVKSPADNEKVSLNTCNMICSQPSLWPKPARLGITDKSTSIIDKKKISFDFSGQGLARMMLKNATDLFKKNLEFLKSGNQTTPGIELNIRIILADSDTYKLRLNMDESYQLTVKKTISISVSISANNFFGARHALETLSQLIWYDDVIDELRILHDVYISDSPKFPYRGVMIDTARNYFPMPLIKKVIDGMAMSKLNILHLHVTDAVSFPIILPSNKKFAAFGAYGPDMIYTPDDIRSLVEFALFRGVRVILEVDAPSHVNAGWNGFKEKYVICGETDVFNGHLNPDNNNTLLLLKSIYSDLLDLTGNREIFHMGSDEVNLTCWRDTKAAKSRNLQQNMKKFWAEYTNEMLATLKSANGDEYPGHVVMWSSPLTESSYVENLNFKVTVHHWLGSPQTILNQGHKVIYSTVGHWYLDCGFGRWRPSMNTGVCDPYTPWQTFYEHRPWVTNGHRELTLGGEVCLWTEQVEVDTLETRIWPRSAAFAERVWGDPETKDDYDVYTRLVSFSDRLKSRGIKVAGMWPRWCSQNPGKC